MKILNLAAVALCIVAYFPALSTAKEVACGAAAAAPLTLPAGTQLHWTSFATEDEATQWIQDLVATGNIDFQHLVLRELLNNGYSCEECYDPWQCFPEPNYQGGNAKIYAESIDGGPWWVIIELTKPLTVGFSCEPCMLCGPEWSTMCDG